MPGQGLEMGTRWNIKRVLPTRPRQTGTAIARSPRERRYNKVYGVFARINRAFVYACAVLLFPPFPDHTYWKIVESIGLQIDSSSHKMKITYCSCKLVGTKRGQQGYSIFSVLRRTFTEYSVIHQTK